MDVDGRLDERAGRGGGWRNAFLNRHRKSDLAADEEDGIFDVREGGRNRSVDGGRNRSTSRPRASSRPPRQEGGPESFNQQAVLDQDRALIEQLTQRQPRRDRSAVRKPPPPPKVTPYRPRGAEANVDVIGDTMPLESTPASPQRSVGPATPQKASALPPHRVLESASPQRQADILPAMPQSNAELAPTETGILAAALASCDDTSAGTSPRHDARGADPGITATATPPVAAASLLGTAGKSTLGRTATPPMKPVVPRTGELFTATDIDSIFDSLGDGKQARGQGGKAEEMAAAAFVGSGLPAAAAPAPAPAPALGTPGQCTQNFQDVANDFFQSHGMQVPTKPAAANVQQDAAEADGQQTAREFKIPERKALREQINAIDSWLEDDFTAREHMSERRSGRGPQSLPGGDGPVKSGAATAAALDADLKAAPGASGEPAEAEIFRKLEDAKRRKALGERMSPVTLKNLAIQAKPLFPRLPLEKLVQALRLFTSARCEDHDLYLRILGEIPVQIRGISPELLTTCVRVLWRLRLHEETYLELFSMEAMNMIRASRKPAARAPRRAPAPRNVNVDHAATAAVGSTAPVPVPPSQPPPASVPEAPTPFNAEQLIHLGNALSRLGAKHPVRFMEVFQEQLALAIPRLKQEECELVCPTLAMSQLMHDPLRRVFLERCAQVEAGTPLALGAGGGAVAGSAAPDIAEYQREADRRRKRAKYFRNIYIIEASVRKETFSFFSSLPSEVRAYLDRLHADAASLTHEGSSAFASQVATVLDQLGVSCDTKRMVGPLGLHVVAKATNPRAEVQEIIYECSDASSFYAVPQDDRNAVPQLTAWAKLRHRLLQRLGMQLTHISVWEWQSMSEAQRINYMVKVQSLQ
mmetsp:Transcript_59031/g.111230  ORF Transcript_59031/g.111230 Transcript_59031/m.111230 type:complete len:872 (-) Transcript_59031:186-2801(-)